jgi:hypothetical protein
VTPTSFLELIKAFKGLLQDKRDEILGAKVSQLSSAQLSLAQLSSAHQLSQSVTVWQVSQSVRQLHIHRDMWAQYRWSSMTPLHSSELSIV